MAIAAPDRPYRIAIDARPFALHHCGFTQYLKTIVEPLRAAGFDLTLLTNRPFRPEHDIVAGMESEIFGSGNEFYWEHRDVPAFLKGREFDVFFSGFNRGVPWRKRRGIRYVQAVLDIIPLLYPRMYIRRPRFPYFQPLIISQMIAILRADAVLTISEASARDIRRVFRVKNVTPIWIKLPAVPPPEPREPAEQFVYVGGVDPRKQVGVLIRAFALFKARHPSFKLVLIGRLYEWFDSLVEELGLVGSVVNAGVVDEQTKIRTISESWAMVYPSLYEGYGLAIAEAYQCGIPVLVGRGGSQAEIAGDAALFIEPQDPADIAAAMERILDPALRDEMIAKGRERLGHLTDEKIGRDTVDYFRKQAALARASG